MCKKNHKWLSDVDTVRPDTDFVFTFLHLLMSLAFITEGNLPGISFRLRYTQGNINSGEENGDCICVGPS